MIFRRSSVLSLALLLASCGVIPTQYLANGNRYQDDTPLSTPAPTRPWTDEAAHPDLNHLGDNTASWQGAVYELITPLAQIVPPTNGPVSIVAKSPASPADASLDHYLRQGLVSYGYQVNPVAKNTGIILVYHAEPLRNPEAFKKAQAKFGKEIVSKDNVKDMYYLTLGIKAKEMLVSEQSSIGIIPYEKNEYMRMPGLSYQPVQGKAAKKRPVYETRD